MYRLVDSAVLACRGARCRMLAGAGRDTSRDGPPDSSAPPRRARTGRHHRHEPVRRCHGLRWRIHRRPPRKSGRHDASSYMTWPDSRRIKFFSDIRRTGCTCPGRRGSNCGRTPAKPHPRVPARAAPAPGRRDAAARRSPRQESPGDYPVGDARRHDPAVSAVLPSALRGAVGAQPPYAADGRSPGGRGDDAPFGWQQIP